MNSNTVLSAIIVGGAAIAAAGAVAVSSGYNPLRKYATVVAVEPAFETSRTPRIVCGDEATLAAAQAQAESSALAPPADAAVQPVPPPAPDVAPEPAQQATAKPAGSEIPQCLTVFDVRSIESGFEVTYELDGVRKVVRMDRDPGRRIPIEDGELVLGQS